VFDVTLEEADPCFHQMKTRGRRVRSGYANDWLHKKISDEVGMTYTQTLFGGHSLACFPSYKLVLWRAIKRLIGLAPAA
jgi:hypothetical protein